MSRQPFRFTATNRLAIVAAYPSTVRQDDREDYVALADGVITDLIAAHEARQAFERALPDFHKGLERLRKSAATFLRVFEDYPQLNRDHPLPLKVMMFATEISHERLLLQDDPAHAGRAGRPPNTLQFIAAVNLRHAYIMAGQQSAPAAYCWRVIRVTLARYAKQRTSRMPTLTLTADAKRRALMA
jgi:hypothetical protein